MQKAQIRHGAPTPPVLWGKDFAPKADGTPVFWMVLALPIKLYDHCRLPSPVQLQRPIVQRSIQKAPIRHGAGLPVQRGAGRGPASTPSAAQRSRASRVGAASTHPESARALSRGGGASRAPCPIGPAPDSSTIYHKAPIRHGAGRSHLDLRLYVLDGRPEPGLQRPQRFGGKTLLQKLAGHRRSGWVWHVRSSSMIIARCQAQSSSRAR